MLKAAGNRKKQQLQLVRGPRTFLGLDPTDTQLTTQQKAFPMRKTVIMANMNYMFFLLMLLDIYNPEIFTQMDEYSSDDLILGVRRWWQDHGGADEK